jgi:predicted MPP superfamily phosphohydrolase
MTHTVTWLHLSDLHATTKDKLEQKRCWDALARDIRENYSHRDSLTIGKPDLVIVSGDIVGAGTPANFRVATEALKILCDAAEVPNQSVYLVPGNHDIARSQVPKVDDELRRLRLRITDADDLREAVDRFWESTALKQLERKFRSYLKFAENYAIVTPAPLGSWVATTGINGVSVRLSGLNSVWNGGHHTLDAAGVPLVGMIQRENIDNASPAPDQSTVHLVIQHNSTDYLNVIDGILHDAWLGEKDAIVLAGHVHNAQTAERRSVDGRHLSIIGGALYAGYHGAADRCYSIGRLAVDRDRRDFTIDLRKQSPMGSFTNDTGRYRKAPTGRISFSLSTAHPALGETEGLRMPEGTGELRLRRDFVSLRLEDEQYFATFEKEYLNETDDPISAVTARLIVNIFPDDPKRARQYYRKHPFTLKRIGFRAESEGRPLRVKLVHDHNENKEVMLLLENAKHGKFPIVPGGECKVAYTFAVSTDLWGSYLERNIQLPTALVECELSFPEGRVQRLWGIRDPHILNGTRIEPAVERRREAGRVLYHWQREAPRLSSRYRLSWTWAKGRH